jgi:hypothetical protein
VRDVEAFVLERERKAGVRFNTPSWSGAPGFFRACFSIPLGDLDEALRRLERE